MRIYASHTLVGRLFSMRTYVFNICDIHGEMINEYLFLDALRSFLFLSLLSFFTGIHPRLDETSRSKISDLPFMKLLTTEHYRNDLDIVAIYVHLRVTHVTRKSVNLMRNLWNGAIMLVEIQETRKSPFSGIFFFCP